MGQVVPLLLAGAIILFVIFTITWAIQLKTKNATIVDSVWSASFPILCVTYSIMSDGYLYREIIITTMVLIWGMRLSIYLFVRTLGHPEDVRYTALRNEWGKNQNVFMLRFFYVQAILALFLSLPFIIIIINPITIILPVEFIGMFIWMIAFIGESIADAQMNKFRTNPKNKDQVCSIGLWKYSRHPNYFFEWLIWISFFVMALASPWGFISVTTPLAILYFLLKVTGIPYTEAQLVISRGEAYKKYQKNTSSFIPWTPKNNTAKV
jgi:steroid 5-alpha reductase family enzyme